MSVRCDACHRATPPGERFCDGCRREAENRTLSDFQDDQEEKAISEEEAADAVRYALSRVQLDSDHT